jgi:EmrB/QacA subfamily drug resistance transporter
MSEPTGWQDPGVSPENHFQNRYIILIIVLSAVFMGVLDTNVVYLALHKITTDFVTDLAQTQWVITAYLIANTSLLLIFGRLSEHTGKAKLFLAGIALFTVSSLACGLSAGIGQLIFFRIIQGIGASLVFSINTAILVTSFPRDERGRVLGLLGTVVAIGSIIGPALGGFIIGVAGWQYVFLINVPIGAALVVFALRYLKLEETTTETLHMDWRGSGLLVTAIVSIMLLLGSLADDLTLSPLKIAYGLVFATSVAGFLYVESRCRNPIVDLSAFRIRKFAFANLSTLLNFLAISMMTLALPFYLVNSLGLQDYFKAGQVMLVIPFVMAVVSPLSGWIYDRFQSHYHSSFGMLVMAVALVAMGIVAPLRSLPLLLACLALFGIGGGLFTSPNNSEVMSSLPLHKSGIASSTLATVRNFGSTTGVSVVSILLYIVIQGEVIKASAEVMANAISVVTLIGGLLCLLGMVTSLLIRRK